jgi:hypothetical protein
MNSDGAKRLGEKLLEVEVEDLSAVCDINITFLRDRQY